MWHRFVPGHVRIIAQGVLYGLHLQTWAAAAGGTLSPTRTFAAASGTIATYIADHLSEPSSYSADAWSERFVLALSALGVLAACAAEPDLIAKFATFVALAACYDRPVPGTAVRIKALFPFSKTLFVPAMHVLWCATISETPLGAASWLWMGFYYVLLNVAMDVKDVADDRRKGVVTVPNTFGAEPTLRGLCVACALGAGVAVATAQYAMAATLACFGAHLFSFVGANTPPNDIVFYYDVWRLLGFYGLSSPPGAPL